MINIKCQGFTLWLRTWWLVFVSWFYQPKHEPLGRGCAMMLWCVLLMSVCTSCCMWWMVWNPWLKRWQSGTREHLRRGLLAQSCWTCRYRTLGRSPSACQLYNGARAQRTLRMSRSLSRREGAGQRVAETVDVVFAETSSCTDQPMAEEPLQHNLSPSTQDAKSLGCRHYSFLHNHLCFV